MVFIRPGLEVRTPERATLRILAVRPVADVSDLAADFAVDVDTDFARAACLGALLLDWALAPVFFAVMVAPFSLRTIVSETIETA